MIGLSHPLWWWLANPVIPAQGQQCLITDLKLYKYGDGENYFNALPFVNFPPVSIWFSTYQNVPNISTPTDFELKYLLGGTFVQEADKATFEFTITPVNNSNAKTVGIYFNSTLLLSITVPTSSAAPINVKGFIKCIDYAGGKAQCSISVNNAPTIIIVSGVNFAANSPFRIVGTGVANGDITYNGGDGVIYIIPRFNNI